MPRTACDSSQSDWKSVVERTCYVISGNYKIDLNPFNSSTSQRRHAVIHCHLCITMKSTPYIPQPRLNSYNFMCSVRLVTFKTEPCFAEQLYVKTRIHQMYVVSRRWRLQRLNFKCQPLSMRCGDAQHCHHDVNISSSITANQHVPRVLLVLCCPAFIDKHLTYQRCGRPTRTPAFKH